MARFNQRYDSAPFPQCTAPSAPPLPSGQESLFSTTATAPPFPSFSSYTTSATAPPFPSSSSSTPAVNASVPPYHFPSAALPPSGYPYAPPPHASYGCCSPATALPFSQGAGVPFPPGTPPEIVQSFHVVDTDRSGVIDERELQVALSSGYQQFNIRTVRLLLFIFKNRQGPLGLGPAEFAVLWDCIGQWRTIFRNFDKDGSGRVDSTELKDALRSLGYVIPSSVTEVIVTQYSDGRGGPKALDFDNFVECVAIVRGLTEKFKERDTRFTGSATLTYDTFMSMVIPFIVP